MKKFTLFLIIFSILIARTSFLADAAFTSAVETQSDVVYVYSLDADRTVIYEKNAEKIVNCSALAKVVTAYLVTTLCDDYSQLITVPATPIRALDSVSCTRVGILVGEVISVQELLYCMMIANAADAGNVLAYHFGGDSISAFVEKMNEFAAELGCENTHFADPNGLEDMEQYTTAKDFALIYEKCLTGDYFAQIAGMDYYKMPATNKYYETRYLHTTNLCMDYNYPDYYCEQVVNGKVATDSNTLGYAVSTATKDGYTYLAVVLAGPSVDYDEDGNTENMAMVDTANVYDWIFDKVKLRVVVKTSTIVDEVKVNHSAEYDYVSLVPMIEVSALVPEGIDSESVYIRSIAELTKTEVDAPVHKGDVLGTAGIYYADEEIARVDLVASFDVERSYSRFISESLQDLFTHPVFIIIISILLLAGGGFGVYVYFFSSSKKFKGKKIRIIKGYEVIDKKKKK
ncbi:MAG: D-alanyl-D-alanine carboxypeptidase [Ruminococcaceae bacterium]|nr:D-alanyl-D-alanine carboxypeptidase [Oscillospiraceae bacterium]